MKVSGEYLQNYFKITDTEVLQVKSIIRDLFKKVHVDLDVFYLKFESSGSYTIDNGKMESYEIWQIIIDEKPMYEFSIFSDREIGYIQKIIDDEEIRNECILQKFPYNLDGTNIIHYNGNTIQINNHDLEVIELYDDPIESHQPFYNYENYIENDKIVRIPEYDTNDLLAVVVSRYAWGMNVATGFISIAHKKIYLWSSYNFDYPCGIALRLHHNNDNRVDIQIYVSDGACERIDVYVSPEINKCITNYHHSSEWIDLNLSEDFFMMRANMLSTSC